MTASDVPSPRNGTAYRMFALTLMSHRMTPERINPAADFQMMPISCSLNTSVVGERHLPELRASVSRHLGFGFAEAAI